MQNELALLANIHSEEAEKPWLARYEKGMATSLHYENKPIFHWLDKTAETNPDALACAFLNTKISYKKLQKQAEIFATNLRANGVQIGDRVGLMLPNIPQTIIAFWGILKAGAVVTMINPLYMEKELCHQVKDADLKHLITIDSCWPKFAKLRNKLGIERYYVTSSSEALSFPLNLFEKVKASFAKNKQEVPFDNKTVFPFSSLLKGVERFSHTPDNPRTTTALLQYTGGTTGVSKGVILTHGNLVANAFQINNLLQSLHGKEQTIMAVLPFFHVYGLTCSILIAPVLEAKIVPVPRFSPAEILADIAKHKVSVLPGAPSLYIAILNQKRSKSYDLTSLKICISGSAPMPVESLKLFEEAFGATLVEGYGLSEASPVTHLNQLFGNRKIGSIGLPLADTEARIVDMELGSVAMPVGKIGELIIRGPQVMQGYWNSPDETANALRNGWLYTGDIAYMDEDGFFTIVDRKKDMIIVGGYNVSPREIDEVLYEHPKIKEAVTVGVSHPTRGETIKAYVVLKDGESMEKAEVMSWCREKLANFKVPRQVEFRETLPKTVVGKILRRTLQAEEHAKQSVEGDTNLDND